MVAQVGLLAALVGCSPAPLDCEELQASGLEAPECEEPLECQRDEDCGESSSCAAHACSDGTCVRQLEPAGTPVGGAQVAGDCQQLQCDGAGGQRLAPHDQDPPASSGECKLGVCHGGAPGEENLADGSPCGGGVGQCEAGLCRLPRGQACSADGECQTGFCADGVCCNSRCSGICASCNRPGLAGTCSQVGVNQDDPGTCDGALTCTGSPGECKLKLGQPCSSNAECVSFSCAGSPKTCQ